MGVRAFRDFLVLLHMKESAKYHFSEGSDLRTDYDIDSYWSYFRKKGKPLQRYALQGLGVSGWNGGVMGFSFQTFKPILSLSVTFFCQLPKIHAKESLCSVGPQRAKSFRAHPQLNISHRIILPSISIRMVKIH
jgi:hypothetical protein